MSTIKKGRHVGFITSGSNKGMPIIREFSGQTCIQDGLDPTSDGNRLVGFTSGGLPITAQALICCYHPDDCERVEYFDWFPEGITQTVLIKSFNAINCESARGNSTVLTYCASFDAEGPKPATSAVSTGVGGAWSNPTSVFTEDGSYAVASPGGSTTATLRLTGFGGTPVPSSVTILGIQIRIKRKAANDDTGANTTSDAVVRLRKTSGAVGDNKAFTTRSWPSAVGWAFYGSPNDLWGTTWTPAEVNSSDFGVDIQAQSIGSLLIDNPAMIDFVSITIYHTFEVGHVTEECEWEDCGADPAPVVPCDTCDYDDTGRGKWVGSIAFRGGTLSLELCLTDLGDLYAFPQVPPTFNLIYRGCNEGCVEISLTVDCYDPLLINFGQILLADCCDCTDTIDPSQVNLFLYANCYQTVLARVIGFTQAGIPIAAVDNCGGDTEPGPCAPTCELVATISNITNCACMAGTYAMPYITGNFWRYQSGWPGCPAAPPGQITMSCSPNLTDGVFNGTITLLINIVCGTDNTGSSTAIINYRDLENLDVTFTVDMVDPTSSGCTGFCNWQYIAMTLSWTLLGNTCTGIGCNPCPVQPVNPPASPVDLQLYDEPCTGTSVVDCCIGTISVRVMR